MGWKEQIYPHLPIPLQNAVCTVRGQQQRTLRYGGVFRSRLAWLQESQWWTKDDIEVYQIEQLRKLIQHAYSNTTYYRRIFDEHGLKPSDIQTIADLAKVPILTKEDVRQHMQELVSHKTSRQNFIPVHTSGSTGKSLNFYQEPSAIQFRWAVWWRHKMRFKVPFDGPYATFTGLLAVPLNQLDPPYWRENLAMKQTIFTMHHITPRTLDAVVDRLNRGSFTYYTGYPSILNVLANLILEHGKTIVAKPEIIFTGAENLYEDQRTTIQQAFGAPVTDQYGFSEGCGNASRCEHDQFHEDFEFGILECAQPEPALAGVRGRILATGFASFGFPFIRYDVGDIGVWSTATCACGRHSKVLTRIEGRIEDYVVTPEGRKLQRFDYIFKDTHEVKEAQVVQTAENRIKVRVVRRENYSALDENLIRREFCERVSNQMLIEFEYPDSIEREPSGKFRAVKSLLK